MSLPSTSTQTTTSSLPVLAPAWAQDGLVLGVDLGGTNMRAALVDASGGVVDEVEVTRHGTTGEASFRQLVELLERLQASPKTMGRPILGAGIGAPGFTDHLTGEVHWAPSLDWRDYPLKARLESHFAFPVVVDNDVNMAALGELHFGAGRGVSTLVLVAIGTGIGSGIVIDGALYRGAHGASGEIGYFLTSREQLGKEYAAFGALESRASGRGIAELGLVALKGAGGDVSQGLLAEEVFAAARQGEAWAQAVVAGVVDDLAMTLANVSAFFDPEIIVLAGGVARSADLLVEPILKRIHNVVPVLPRLVVTGLGRWAAVLGAVASIWQTLSGEARPASPSTRGEHEFNK